jgi:hypothetical protein
MFSIRGRGVRWFKHDASILSEIQDARRANRVARAQAASAGTQRPAEHLSLPRLSSLLPGFAAVAPRLVSEWKPRERRDGSRHG